MAKEKKKKVTQKPGPPTQRYLDISEIREGAVILKDGTLRAVIMVGSINYALKSTDEQEAIVQSYMQMLNTLEFPLQIVIQSRKMNIDAYINSLREYQKMTTNIALQNQMEDYLQFITELISMGEIMQKRFYAVVSYDPSTDKKKNFLSRLSESLSPKISVKLKEQQFQERKKELMARVETISGQLGSMGLITRMLETQALIELYYYTYNLESAKSQKLPKDIGKLKIEQ